MDTMTIEEFKQLASLQDRAAVSVYLPTHLAPDGRQDAIRLTKLLERAQDELQARGVQPGEAVEMLAAAAKLPSVAEFWKGLSQGLAIFVARDRTRAYRLPHAFDESVTVNPRLNIKPLLPVVDRAERYLLLVLSQNRVRLLEVSRGRIQEIKSHKIPANKRQALNYDGADRGEQVHEGMRGNLGKQAAIFHGQGGEKDTAKSDIVQFFQIINRALAPLLNKESAPLLLAGVDYLLPLFRQTCSYAHLMERHLAGNCDLLTSQQLHERSWEIMRPYFDRPRREAIERLHDLLGTGKASAESAEVVGAAATGKIDVLLVDPGEVQLGTFDPNVGKANLCDRSCPHSEDLVNLALAETLLHGGVVYAVEPGQLPDETGIAAIYRY